MFDVWCGLNVTVSSREVNGEVAGLVKGCENVGGLTALGLGVSKPLSADAEGRKCDADAFWIGNSVSADAECRNSESADAECRNCDAGASWIGDSVGETFLNLETIGVEFLFIVVQSWWRLHHYVMLDLKEEK